MANIFNMQDTWNSAGTEYTAIEMDAQDVASTANTALLDLKVGGSSKFRVRKDGALFGPGGIPIGGGGGGGGGGRELLISNRTYYVAATGTVGASDSNDGLTVGSSFATIQHAVNLITSTIDLGGFRVTIQLANGIHTITDFDGVTFKDPIGGYGFADFYFHRTEWKCEIRGDPTTPSNVTLNGVVDCLVLLTVMGSRVWRLNGVKLTGGGVGALLSMYAYVDEGQIELDNIEFNVAQESLIFVYATKNSFVRLGPDDDGTHIHFTGSGNVDYAYFAQDRSVILSGYDVDTDCHGAALNFTGAISFAKGNSYMWEYNNYFNTVNITGRPYRVVTGSQIYLRRLDAVPGTLPPEIQAGSMVHVYNGGTGSIPGELYTQHIPSSQYLGEVAARTTYKYSGITVTNEGASGLVEYTLDGLDPTQMGETTVSPREHSFVVQNANGIKINVVTGFTIRVGTVVSVDAGSIESYTVGSTLTLRCINLSEWVATSFFGTWTVT